MIDNRINFDENDYEFNKESNIGIMIIHGFTSTTCEVKSLAKYLGEKGFHTSAKNLPGHGTTIEDCNQTKYKEWLQFVEQNYAEMMANNDKVFIIGLSMGGVLGLHLSTLFPVDGLVAAATVFKFNDQKKLEWLNPITKYFLPYLSKKSRYDPKIRNNLTFYGYNRYPLRAIDEFLKMTKIVQKKLYKVKTPTLILHSQIDVTSKKENVDIVKNNIASSDVQIIKYLKATHNLFVKSEEQKLIFSDIYNFIQKLNK